MIVPILHRILVKPKDLAEANDTYKRMKEAGLVIAEHSDTKRESRAVEIGTVISIGETCFKDFGATDPIKVGDIVYFAKYSGKDVKDSDGTEYLLLNDEDVIALVKD